MEFNKITEALKLIRGKKISVEELNKIFIKKVKENNKINALIYFNEDIVIEQSKKIDNSKKDLLLKGIPLAIKDLFCTKNMPTTAGSKILSNFQPTYESFVTSKLLNHGAVFIGKANLDEFAMGSATTTSYFGNTIKINPF